MNLKNLTLVTALIFVVSACTHVGVKQNRQLKTFTLTNEPAIGTTPAGDQVLLGGFSGLQVLGRTGSTFELLTLTDRGPNGPLVGRNRSFLIPNYAPRFVKLRLNIETGDLVITDEIPFRGKLGLAMSGLPPASKQSAIEAPVDAFGHRLRHDPNGVDSESLCVDSDRTIWVGEEYGPDLLHFQSDGMLIDRVKPGHGLPNWLHHRRVNRGFEGIACSEHHVYMMLQSPLDIPAKNDVTVRLLDYDTNQKKVVGVYVYLLDSPKNIIGDLHAADPHRFVVIEQNGKTGAEAVRNLYLFDIANAQNWIDRVQTPQKPENKVQEELNSLAVSKKRLLDLRENGYDVQKAEGLAIFGNDIFLVSDNDFGITGEVDFKRGHISLAGKKTIFAWLPQVFNSH